MNKDITELITYVIDLIKDVPEEFRKSSFEVLLNHFLIQSSLPSKSIVTKKSTMKKSSEIKNLELMLSTEIDWASTGIKKFKGIIQYLALLKIAKTELDDVTLSASEIKTILEQKFREKKTVNTISMSLMDAVGKYVDRVKEDKEWRYRITASGENRLEEFAGDSKN
ncbi:MAG: hypothetical protein OER82_02035 [Nitrosopumilus sp.]|nr:hypothetical protein [Nitrosopumilus sp.]